MTCLLLASGKCKVKSMSSIGFRVSLQRVFAGWVKRQVPADMLQASPNPAPGPGESSTWLCWAAAAWREAPQAQDGRAATEQNPVPPESIPRSQTRS